MGTGSTGALLRRRQLILSFDEKKHIKTGPRDYFCTWGAQWRFGSCLVSTMKEEPAAVDAADPGYSVSSAARNCMSSDFLFRNPGIAYAFPEDIRKDLYFVMDDGWDVTPGIDMDKTGKTPFGSLELNEERFPEFPGTPEERLEKLNRRIQDAGWKGLGIWVAAQMPGDSDEIPWDEDASRRFWEERLRWCRNAGVHYWKVDWGARMKDHRFHILLEELAEKTAPEIRIEHAWGTWNINQPKTADSEYGRFASWDDGNILEESARMASYSSLFRTYDTKGPLETPITLDRTAELLRRINPVNPGKGLINCESAALIGAALGCSLGIMGGYRFSDEESPDESDIYRRVIRWHRIVPPWSKHHGEKINVSTITNGDYWETEKEGKPAVRIRQGCYAMVARGIELPEVTAERELPYIMASCDPGGIMTVAADKRAFGKRHLTPAVQIKIPVRSNTEHIGFFGHIDRVVLKFQNRGPEKRVLYRDLLHDEYKDITSSCTGTFPFLILPEKVSRIDPDGGFPGFMITLLNKQ